MQINLDLNYTEEEIRNAKQVVEVRLVEDGIRVRPVKVIKVNPKSLRLEESVYVRGSRKDIVYIGDVGQSSPLTGSQFRDSFYVTASAIVLDKDVELVKEDFMLHGRVFAKERIKQLEKQLEIVFTK